MANYIFNSTSIDYSEIGEGIPVLFVHGWGVDKNLMIGAFEPIFAKLNGFKRYYIDLPGMGKSTHEDITCSDNILDMLHKFAADIIKDKFIIVGQSYGGYLSRGFVNKYQNELKGIMLLCPLVIPGYRKGRFVPHNVLQKDEEFLKTLSKEDYDNFSSMNVVLTKDVYERYESQILIGVKNADNNFLGKTLKGEYSFDVDKMVSKVSIPCLIIAGKQDTEVGYKDQFDLMENYINASYFAINKAGHNLQIEQPELFSSITKSWFMNEFLK